MNSHRLPSLALLCSLLTAGRLPAAAAFNGAPYADGDLFADTWVATDALGRVAPGFDECGPVNPDKWAGIFYWTWHTPGRGGPNDNTKILATAHDGIVDWPTNGAPYHWGEPELGYYVMTDPFVIRKHASMLADAGIDVILFDTTNPPFTWKEEYEALCGEYTAMRKEGARTPAIAFIAPFGDPRPVTDQLWRDLYQPAVGKTSGLSGTANRSSSPTRNLSRTGPSSISSPFAGPCRITGSGRPGRINGVGSRFIRSMSFATAGVKPSRRAWGWPKMPCPTRRAPRP